MLSVEQKDIVFYTDADFNLAVKVRDESVWLSLSQLSHLFERDKSVISRHLKNIFKEEELSEESVVAKNATTASDGKKYNVSYYNLDAIISVGYRVNSKKGTQFRIWATQVLKDHLVKGYTQNKHRLTQLKKTIQLVNRTAQLTNETKDLLDLLNDYTVALDLLDDYDHERLTKDKTSQNVGYKIAYHEAKRAIEELRQKFGASSLFGNEKDQSFQSSIAVIDQTFDEEDLYPSIEEKAANLLYLVVKNHSFTDGNKRIAAWLFIWYLSKNHFLYQADGSQKISNNALVALTLMIAESNPNEKETMVNVIINLINA